MIRERLKVGDLVMLMDGPDRGEISLGFQKLPFLLDASGNTCVPAAVATSSWRHTRLSLCSRRLCAALRDPYDSASFLMNPKRLVGPAGSVGKCDGSYTVSADLMGSPSGSRPKTSHTGARELCSAPMAYDSVGFLLHPMS